MQTARRMVARSLGLVMVMAWGGAAHAALVAPTVNVTTTYSSPTTTNMALRVATTGANTQDRFRPIFANRTKTVAMSGSDVSMEATLDLCWQDFPTNGPGQRPSQYYRFWDFTAYTGSGNVSGGIVMPLTWSAYDTNSWVRATGAFTLPHQILDNAGPSWVEVTSYSLSEDRTYLLYDGGTVFDGYVVYAGNITLRKLPGGPNLEVNGTFDTDNTGWELSPTYSPTWSSYSLSAVYGSSRALQPGPYAFQQGMWNGRTGLPRDCNVQDAHVISSGLGANLDYMFIRKFPSGYFVPVFRFDLTALAPHVGRATNATLTLTVSDTQGQPPGNTGTHYVYALPAGNTTWTETTAKGSEQSPGVSWLLAGGGPAADAYNAAIGGTLIGTKTFAATPAIGSTVVYDLNPAAVNTWLATPANYAGLAILQPDDDTLTLLQFHSSEAAVATNRPLLQIAVPPLGTTVSVH